MEKVLQHADVDILTAPCSSIQEFFQQDQKL